MDVLAHTLWTNVVFYLKYSKDRSSRYWAAFFGVLPDLLSFIPVVIYMILNGLRFDPAHYNGSASWAFRFALESYNYTHSMVIFLFIFFIVMAWKGRPYWPLLGWALHIVIDIFTHPNFFQTPFLFPLSGFRNSHAIAWSHPIFMIVNYTLLALTYVFIFLYFKPKYNKDVVPSSAVIPEES